MSSSQRTCPPKVTGWQSSTAAISNQRKRPGWSDRLAVPCQCALLALLMVLLSALPRAAVAQVCVPPPAGLISWWPGDGNANDIQGVNDGTLLDGATFAPGMVGQAFSFNGASHVSAPTTDLPIGNNNRTTDLWVKVNNFLEGQAFFAGYGSFGFFGEAYKLGTQGNISFFSQWGDAVFGPALQTGRWHHIAATNVGNSVTLYVDGAVVASGDLSMNTASGTQLFIGSLPGDPFRRLDGLVDEVGVYDRALSPAEIQAIFNAGSAGKCKPEAFASFVAEATLSLGPQGEDDAFDLQATFTLGTDSSGINPLTDIVHLQVGPLAITISAGSFRGAPNGSFVFEGVIEGVTIRAVLIPPKGEGGKSKTFKFEASGGGANLTGTEVPVSVGLTIGDNSGSTTLTMVEVRARSSDNCPVFPNPDQTDSERDGVGDACENIPGNLDGDNDVDQSDINILLADRNKSVSQSTCGASCDLDADGKITALDARKLTLLCTRPRCATQ